MVAGEVMRCHSILWKINIDDDDGRSPLASKVTFIVGETFNSFEEVKNKVSAFEEDNSIRLYVRCSRSVEAAHNRAPKKQFKDELRYFKLEYFVFVTVRILQVPAKDKGQVKTEAFAYHMAHALTFEV